MSAAFARFGVCDRINYIRGAERQLVDPLPYVKGDGPYHPNAGGQRLYSEVLSAFLRQKYQEGARATRTGLPANPPATAPAAAAAADAVFAAAEGAVAPAASGQAGTDYAWGTVSVAGAPVGACPAARTGDVATISGGDFAPGSSVVASVNDASLTTVAAGADGIAQAALTLPATGEGLYRIALRGTGAAGGTIIRYAWLQPVTAIPTCDRVAPTISVSSPVADATYTVGQSVTAGYTCSDPQLQTCQGTVATGQTIDTTQAGAYTFDVVADDATGNTFETSVTYTVVAKPQLPVLADPATAGLMAALAAATVTDHDGDLATPDRSALTLPATTSATTTINGCSVPTPATQADSLLLLAGQPYQSRTGPAPAASPQCRPAAVTTTLRP